MVGVAVGVGLELDEGLAVGEGVGVGDWLGDGVGLGVCRENACVEAGKTQMRIKEERKAAIPLICRPPSRPARARARYAMHAHPAGSIPGGPTIAECGDAGAVVATGGISYSSFRSAMGVSSGMVGDAFPPNMRR